jgi:hypothetical protein
MDTLKPSDAEDLQASIKDPNVKLASAKDNIFGTQSVVMENEKSGEKEKYENVPTEEIQKPLDDNHLKPTDNA